MTSEILLTKTLRFGAFAGNLERYSVGQKLASSYTLLKRNNTGKNALEKLPSAFVFMYDTLNTYFLDKTTASLAIKASAVVVLLYKSFWVFTRRHFLVRNRFGTTCVSHLQGLEVNQEMDEV